PGNHHPLQAEQGRPPGAGGHCRHLGHGSRHRGGAATLAEFLLEHFTGAWALRAATLLVEVATRGHVKLLAIAMLGDSALSAVEGLALQAGRWWAPWLVVIATAMLLPWELWELFRRPAWGRMVILAVNIAVVLY